MRKYAILSGVLFWLLGSVTLSGAAEGEDICPLPEPGYISRCELMGTLLSVPSAACNRLFTAIDAMSASARNAIQRPSSTAMNGGSEGAKK